MSGFTTEYIVSDTFTVVDYIFRGFTIIPEKASARWRHWCAYRRRRRGTACPPASAPALRGSPSRSCPQSSAGSATGERLPRPVGHLCVAESEDVSVQEQRKLNNSYQLPAITLKSIGMHDVDILLTFSNCRRLTNHTINS